MPAKSKKQFKFMAAVAAGRAKNKPEGLSQEQAKEFIHSNKGSKSYENLPEKTKKRKFKVFGKEKK